MAAKNPYIRQTTIAKVSRMTYCKVPEFQEEENREIIN